VIRRTVPLRVFWGKGPLAPDGVLPLELPGRGALIGALEGADLPGRGCYLRAVWRQMRIRGLCGAGVGIGRSPHSPPLAGFRSLDPGPHSPQS